MQELDFIDTNLKVLAFKMRTFVKEHENLLESLRNAEQRRLYN